jgi:4-amino-4-deoxy-L-arabinose transferase-like glycosyltransferase
MKRGDDAGSPGRLDLTVAAIVLVGVALRFLALGQQSLWYDEVRSVCHVWGADAGTLAETAWSARGPIYLLLLKGWITLLGPGEAQIRMLSAILGSLGLVLFYRVALGLLGRGKALIALAFLACSPFHLWYSQEATNYALLFDLGLLAVPAFLIEVERRTRGSFIVALATTAAACLANMSGFFLYILYAVYLLTSGRQRRYALRRFMMFALLSAVILSPWIVGAARTAGQLHLGRPRDDTGVSAVKGESPPGLASIPFTFYVFSLGNSVGPNTDELKQHRFAAVRPHLWYLVPVGLLFLLIGCRGLQKSGRSVQRVLLPWVAVPVLSMAAASLLNLKPPNARYAFVAFAPYLLYLAIGAGSLRSKTLRAGVIGAVLLCLAGSDFLYFTNPRYWKPDARSAGQLLTREVHPDDVVVVYALEDPLRYYVPASMAFLSPGARDFASEAAMVGWLERNTRGKRRVWIAQYHGWWVDRENRFVRACGTMMTLEREWNFPQVPVYRFARTEPRDAQAKEPASLP